MYGYCRVVGCSNPARAGTSSGLDRRFCRKHADHYSRHGSAYKSSYKARELEPYRRVVRKWLKANKGDRWLRNAIQRIEGLYSNSGRFEEAFRLAGMKPKERARKAWARLRQADVAAEKVVECWLVAELAVRLDEQPDGTREFKQVQAAKLVHRLASGSHRRWERVPQFGGGGVQHRPAEVTELHKYPHSRGRVLRYIGGDMEEACGLVVSEHMGDLLSDADELTRRP